MTADLSVKAATTPEVEELLDEEIETNLDSPWRVILYNDHIHTFDEVIVQLIKATGCSVSQAEAYAWRAHVQGKAGVFEGSFEECLRVKSVLDEIALVTEIQG
ncbi:MAG: ATP-dependent Clp protease adaptor ClpS [Rhodothermaceae bacterium]|nr:ATP-dependent Clp protease adaptor ClpS [Rhodothermaceae bacterium]